MNAKKNLVLIMLVVISSAVWAQRKQEYAVNTSESTVKWAGKKIIGGDTEGTIQIARGHLIVSDNKLTGGEFVIDTRTIASDSAPQRLIAHLKNEDFFDVEKYPSASFVITSTKINNDTTFVTGKITIKGITQDITFPASVHYGDNALTATAVDVTIDRTKFGVQYNSGSIFANLGNKAIADNFVLNISVRAEQKK